MKKIYNFKENLESLLNTLELIDVPASERSKLKKDIRRLRVQLNNAIELKDEEKILLSMIQVGAEITQLASSLLIDNPSSRSTDSRLFKV